MADFQDHPSTVRPGEELNVATLEPFLRGHFPDETGAMRVEQFPNGHSNLTYAIHLGEKQFVLRRPPFGSKVKSAHDMSREFRVLSKLHASYPPAPEVLLFCDDPAVLGAPFYLMKPIWELFCTAIRRLGWIFLRPSPAASANRLSIILPSCIDWTIGPSDLPISASRRAISSVRSLDGWNVTQVRKRRNIRKSKQSRNG